MPTRIRQRLAYLCDAILEGAIAGHTICLPNTHCAPLCGAIFHHRDDGFDLAGEGFSASVTEQGSGDWIEDRLKIQCADWAALGGWLGKVEAVYYPVAVRTGKLPITSWRGQPPCHWTTFTLHDEDGQQCLEQVACEAATAAWGYRTRTVLNDDGVTSRVYHFESVSDAVVARLAA